MSGKDNHLFLKMKANLNKLSGKFAQDNSMGSLDKSTSRPPSIMTYVLFCFIYTLVVGLLWMPLILE